MVGVLIIFWIDDVIKSFNDYIIMSHITQSGLFEQKISVIVYRRINISDREMRTCLSTVRTKIHIKVHQTFTFFLQNSMVKK